VLLFFPGLAFAEQMTVFYCHNVLIPKVQITHHALAEKIPRTAIVDRIIDRFYSHRFFTDAQATAVNEAIDLAINIEVLIPSTLTLEQADAWIDSYIRSTTCTTAKESPTYGG